MSALICGSACLHSHTGYHLASMLRTGRATGDAAVYAM